MSRIATPAPETATGATAELFAQIKKAVGKVPNAYAALGALHPNGLKAMLQADAVLAGGSLAKAEIEIVKLVVSAVAGCDYCVAAHSLAGKVAGLSPDALRRIRSGEATGNARHDALAAFVRAVVTTRGTLGEAKVAAIRAAGYSDAQLVEIGLAVSVIVFTNIFNRINDTDVDFPAVA